MDKCVLGKIPVTDKVNALRETESSLETGEVDEGSLKFSCLDLAKIRENVNSQVCPRVDLVEE